MRCGIDSPIDDLIARDGGPQRIVLIDSATHDPAAGRRMPAPMEGPLAEITAGWDLLAHACPG